MKRIAITAATATFAWLVLQGPAAPADTKQASLTDTAPPETVVVTGRRLDQKNADEVIHNFVDAHAALSPKIHQLARWETPVCPEVRNLPASYASFVKDRIKAIAESVGAPTKKNCGLHELNVEIIFSPDPQKVLDQIAKYDRVALGYDFMDNHRVPILTAPIEAWYLTATSNHMWTLSDEPNPSYAYPGAVSYGRGSILFQYPAGVDGGSRIWSPVYSRFVYVLILVDAKKVAGYPIGPIADYVAMLALSHAKAPDNCSQLASILDYMSPDCSEKPESLTFADKAYLEGLYSMNKEEFAAFQKGDISDHMVKALAGK